MTYSILNLPRFFKIILIILVDISLCIFTLWFSFFLRTEQFIYLLGDYLFLISISITLMLPIFYIFGLYSSILRHTSWQTIVPVSKSILLYTLFFFTIVTIGGINNVPRTLGIIQPIMLYISVVISRVIIKYYLNTLSNNKIKTKKKFRALIYGAGEAGRQLSSTFSSSNRIKLRGFIDDDKSLHGKIINGLRIYSSQNIDETIKLLNITHIFLAIPSAGRNQRSNIIKNISKKSVIVRSLPSLIELTSGKVSISDLNDFLISDLLERNVVKPDFKILAENIKNKIVLITGAGGSIGSEISRQILNLTPKKILLMESNEFALYKIYLELKNILNSDGPKKKIEIFSFLGSIQDIYFLDRVYEKYKPETVFHAAAYKHVSLVEINPIESIKNNVFGSLNIYTSSIKHNCSDLVLVSTDKAVRPKSLMGATKRLSELCLQALYKEHSDKIKMSMVRFGNALDSSGSVIPLFKKQIHDGGPITLTHKDVSRYFMTIPEAAQLVIQASSLSVGGEVFVLEMGNPVKIIDLAKRMIKLSGLTVKDASNSNGDIEIKEIGLAPGEKLHEELLLGEDPQSTSHPKIKKAKDPFILWNELKQDLDTLKQFTDNNDADSAIKTIKKTVTGF